MLYGKDMEIIFLDSLLTTSKSRLQVVHAGRSFLLSA